MPTWNSKCVTFTFLSKGNNIAMFQSIKKAHQSLKNSLTNNNFKTSLHFFLFLFDDYTLICTTHSIISKLYSGVPSPRWNTVSTVLWNPVKQQRNNNLSIDMTVLSEQRIMIAETPVKLVIRRELDPLSGRCSHAVSSKQPFALLDSLRFPTLKTQVSRG